jgi:hypothetical protein
MGIMDDKKKLAATACFALALIFGIVAAATRTWYVSGDSDNGSNTGIWTTSVTVGGTTADPVDIECNAADQAGAPDCASAKDSKCMANKAFIILGVLSNAAAAGLVVTGAGPAIAPTAAGGFAALSYLIVWSIYAGIKNAKPEDCGLDGTDVDYGAGFALAIVATILCGVGAAAAMMAGKE